MSNVVSLRPGKQEGGPSDSGGPHLTGAATCGSCGHKWTATAPVGATHMDCPSCKRLWGAFDSVVEPAVAWKCNCGERLFWLTPKGAMCRGCGIITVDWA